MKKFGAAITTLMLIVSFQNCSDQVLSASAVEGSNGGGGGPLHLGMTDDDATGVVTQTGGPNCRDQLHTSTLPIKPVFIVDVSGSNAPENGSPGSDPRTGGPNKNRPIVRGDSIERFFNTYRTKANFGWSFSTFAGTSANVLLAMGNATSMRNAIDTFLAMGDAGKTPYIAALDAAKRNIQGDTGRAPNTKYLVVFLSDGLPNPEVADAEIISKVREVTATSPGNVSVNTIYYGAVDADASARMRMMATNGGGNFLDTNANPTGKDFLITDLVVIPGVVCN